MSIAITQTIHVLQVIVQCVPMGTNLAPLQLMWTIGVILHNASKKYIPVYFSRVC